MPTISDPAILELAVAAARLGGAPIHRPNQTPAQREATTRALMVMTNWYGRMERIPAAVREDPTYTAVDELEDELRIESNEVRSLVFGEVSRRAGIYLAMATAILRVEEAEAQEQLLREEAHADRIIGPSA